MDKSINTSSRDNKIFLFEEKFRNSELIKNHSLILSFFFQNGEHAFFIFKNDILQFLKTLLINYMNDNKSLKLEDR